MKEAIGEHYILELFDCPFKTLDDESLVAGAVRQACRAGGLTLLGLQSHKFEPQGVTTLGLLSESHISIHTWPEHGYAAADVFTCSNTCSPGRACDSLADLLQAGRSDVSVVARGRLACPAGSRALDRQHRAPALR